MKKKLLFLFVLAIFMFPAAVFANSDPCLADQLHGIIGGETIVIENYDTLNNHYLDGYDENEFTEGSIGYSVAPLVAGYLNELPDVKNMMTQYADLHPYIDVECVNGGECGVAILYDDAVVCSEPNSYTETADYYPSEHYLKYNIQIDVKNSSDINTEVYNWAKGFFTEGYGNGIAYKDFFLYDLDFINLIYNSKVAYSTLVRNWSNNPGSIHYYVPEIHNAIAEKGAVDLKFGKAYQDSDLWNDVEFISTGQYVVLYGSEKPTAYIATELSYHMVPMLFVGADVTDENLVDAAKTRIADYLNIEKSAVVIEDITSNISNMSVINNDVTNLLSLLEITANNNGFKVYSLKIGDKSYDFNFYIMRTNKELAEGVKVVASDVDTSIKFESESPLVPSDAKIEAENVTAAYVAKNEAVKRAFDIKLHSNLNGGYISEGFGKAVLYIPVDDVENVDDLEFAYLDENGEVVDLVDFEVKTIGGHKYVVAEVEHFSVYALVDSAVVESAATVGGGVENPKTVDNIMLYIYTIAFSSICLIGLTAYRKRHTN